MTSTENADNVHKERLERDVQLPLTEVVEKVKPLSVHGIRYYHIHLGVFGRCLKKHCFLKLSPTFKARFEVFPLKNLYYIFRYPKTTQKVDQILFRPPRALQASFTFKNAFKNRSQHLFHSTF